LAASETLAKMNWRVSIRRGEWRSDVRNGFIWVVNAAGYGTFAAAVPENYLASVPSSLGWADAWTGPGVGATANDRLTVLR
jgi:hypothetical protein